MQDSADFDPRAFHARFEIAMIVACSENGVIGRDGDLPWHLPVDLRHFMRSTKGCPVIMGRKTFDTLDQPLSSRLNIVVSRSMTGHESSDVRVASSIDEAIEIARAAQCEDGQSRPIWIAGGGTIYTQAMDRVDLIVRTMVHVRAEGDAEFPELDPGLWNLRHRDEFSPDERHAHGFDIEWWSRGGQGVQVSGF